MRPRTVPAFLTPLLGSLLAALPWSVDAAAGGWPPLSTDVAAISQVDLWVSEWNLFEDRQASDAAPRPEIGKLETRFLDDHVKARPGNVSALTARGLHHLLLGDPGRAIADFDRALKKQPKDAAALYHRGLARERQGDLPKATADYEAAVVAAPESPFARGALANLAMLSDGPSPDQHKTIQRHGMPDAFSVHIAANTPQSDLLLRTEVWTYHRLGREITFLEGRLFDERRFPAEKDTTIHPLYRPHQFATGMRFVDMVEMIREEKYFYMALEDDVVRGGELVATTQLVVGFKDGGLFYVRAHPLVLE